MRRNDSHANTTVWFPFADWLGLVTEALWLMTIGSPWQHFQKTGVWQPLTSKDNVSARQDWRLKCVTIWSVFDLIVSPRREKVRIEFGCHRTTNKAEITGARYSSHEGSKDFIPTVETLTLKLLVGRLKKKVSGDLWKQDNATNYKRQTRRLKGNERSCLK